MPDTPPVVVVLVNGRSYAGVITFPASVVVLAFSSCLLPPPPTPQDLDQYQYQDQHHDHDRDHDYAARRTPRPPRTASATERAKLRLNR